MINSADLSARWLPLGRALRDFHDGKTDALITVESDLWAREETPVEEFYRPEGAALPEIERRSLSLCRGRVLDLGAGAGRHALDLQRLGLEVTAVDISEDAAQVMIERGVRDVRHGNLEVVKGEQYETILLLMHGIGLVGNLEGLADFFSRSREYLSGRGRILCDSADLALVLPKLIEESGNQFEPGDSYFGEVEFCLSYGPIEGQPYPWLFVDPRTLQRFAARAGFRCTIDSRGTRGSYLACIDTI